MGGCNTFFKQLAFASFSAYGANDRILCKARQFSYKKFLKTEFPLNLQPFYSAFVFTQSLKPGHPEILSIAGKTLLALDFNRGKKSRHLDKGLTI